MKPIEFKIGNYILIESEKFDFEYLCVVKEIMSTKLLIQCNEEADWFGYDQVHPIPLTEECLKRFRLEKIGNTAETAKIHWYKIVEGLYIKCTGEGIFLISEGFDGKDHVITKLEYVHAFQNLYFTLTRQELTFDDK